MGETRRVLVTGASSGIGEAAATALAQAGHQVFASARREDRLAALAERRPGITPVTMDVTEPASVAAAVDRIGSVDVLINNAGFAAIGPVEAVDRDEVRRQFDTNVFGLLEVTRAVLPSMRRRGTGRIVNISSVVGRTTFPAMGVYGASKHAVEALSDALRAEVGPHGIDVVVVEPGFVRSDIGSTAGASPEAADSAYRTLTEAATAFLGREIAGGSRPEELAALLVQITEARRPRTRYLFPRRSRVLVGVLGRTPDRVADALKRRAIGAAP